MSCKGSAAAAAEGAGAAALGARHGPAGRCVLTRRPGLARQVTGRAEAGRRGPARRRPWNAACMAIGGLPSGDRESRGRVQPLFGLLAHGRNKLSALGDPRLLGRWEGC